MEILPEERERMGEGGPPGNLDIILSLPQDGKYGSQPERNIRETGDKESEYSYSTPVLFVLRGGRARCSPLFAPR